MYPTEIVGKRQRYRLDGSVVEGGSIRLRRRDGVQVETFAGVYKKLTGKDVSFEFPRKRSKRSLLVEFDNNNNISN